MTTKRTYQPKKRHRERVHGFMKRMSTSNEIGRASCRERVKILEVGGTVKKKQRRIYRARQ